VKPSIGTNGEALWRTAVRLLELERIMTGQVQEVSANYDAATHSCPLFADFGRGSMQSLGELSAGMRKLEGDLAIRRPIDSRHR
jgi:hypothetical protein